MASTVTVLIMLLAAATSVAEAKRGVVQFPEGKATSPTPQPSSLGHNAKVWVNFAFRNTFSGHTLKKLLLVLRFENVLYHRITFIKQRIKVMNHEFDSVIEHTFNSTERNLTASLFVLKMCFIRKVLVNFAFGNTFSRCSIWKWVRLLRFENVFHHRIMFIQQRIKAINHEFDLVKEHTFNSMVMKQTAFLFVLKMCASSKVYQYQII